MNGAGEMRSFKGQIAMAAAGLLLLTGCSGGLPELPSMASLAVLGAETPEASAAPVEADKTKADQKPVNVAELAQPGPLGDVSIGKTNAPVVIVQYYSLTCPNCSRFQAEVIPKLKKAYIDKGKVRLVVREFPIGRSAAAAALVTRCVPEKDYLKVADKFLLNQKDWVAQEVRKDEIYNVVKFTGLKRDKFDACLTNQSINDALVLVKQRGRAFGVAGTPTFFVNGKKVAGVVSFEEMQMVIEAALADPQAPQIPAGQPQAQKPQPKPQQQASAKAT
jgi:protein-disulfide isomerase